MVERYKEIVNYPKINICKAILWTPDLQCSHLDGDGVICHHQKYCSQKMKGLVVQANE